MNPFPNRIYFNQIAEQIAIRRLNVLFMIVAITFWSTLALIASSTELGTNGNGQFSTCQVCKIKKNFFDLKIFCQFEN